MAISISEKIDRLQRIKQDLTQLAQNAANYESNMAEHADELSAVAQGSATGEQAVSLLRAAAEPLQQLQHHVSSAQQAVTIYIVKLSS